MVMVLRNKSKSPIHHVREGGVNGNRFDKLIRIPAARQGRALLSTTTNTKRRQSKAPAQQMHQHTSPAWQNLQNMQSTVACALLVASSTCQLPSTPMGAGARRSSTSSSNRSSTACVQRSGRQPVAQSGAPLQSGSSCSSAQVWQLQEGTR